MDNWTQTLSAPTLLSIAVVAVLLILVLIMKFRVHAFVTLVLVSLLTALATGVPIAHVMGVLSGGFNSTLGSVALLVALGAMLGRLLETSGGAKSLAEALIHKFGEKRAPLALGVASLIFGFPIFFDAGLIVMLPVVFAVARRLNEPVLRYGLPAAGAFSVMHVFVPPHPGAVAAGDLLGVDMGVLIAIGLLVAIPTWYIAAYLYGLWCGKKFPIAVPDLLSGGTMAQDITNPPTPKTVILLLLLPLILIFGNTGLDTLSKTGAVNPDAGWVTFIRMIGNTPIALLIALLVAMYVLGVGRGQDKKNVENIVDGALPGICSVILITGAGGMFGGVLRASGIGDAVASSLDGVGIPVIIAAFVIAGLLRVAQGSATVALMTAAALIQPAVLGAEFSAVQIAAIVIAASSGSVIFSHVNDSGFWLVGKLMNMDVATTFKTWTVMETLIGVVGFTFAYGLFTMV